MNSESQRISYFLTVIGLENKIFSDNFGISLGQFRDKFDIFCFNSKIFETPRESSNVFNQILEFF